MSIYQREMKWYLFINANESSWWRSVSIISLIKEDESFHSNFQQEILWNISTIWQSMWRCGTSIPSCSFFKSTRPQKQRILSCFQNFLLRNLWPNFDHLISTNRRSLFNPPDLVGYWSWRTKTSQNRSPAPSNHEKWGSNVQTWSTEMRCVCRENHVIDNLEESLLYSNLEDTDELQCDQRQTINPQPFFSIT